MNITTRRLLAGFALAALLSPGGALQAQQTRTSAAPAPLRITYTAADSASVARIKEEGFRRSQVMEVASWLTDVHGPRLTNSPQAHAAGEYAIATLRGWGISNPRYEWFPFGRGWQNERNVAHVVSPVPYPVHVFPGAWTAGTGGPVTGEVVIVELPVLMQTTESDYERYRGQLRGKIVLSAPLVEITPMFVAPGRRYTMEQLDSLEAAEPRPAAQPQAGPQQQQQAGPTPSERRANFWTEEGVLAVLTPGAARGNSGSVSNAPSGSRVIGAPHGVPQLAVAAEHYNRIFRQVRHGIPVRMELDIRNSFHEADSNAFNVLAELPGGDKRDEIVMIGAHFDSWHNATGATDNGGSSAIVMEVMRILKASGVSLRRTVRLGLWTGEEQGLIGSRQHVAATYGSAAEPRPVHEKASVYLNIDNGGGAVRGIYAQGNAGVVGLFRDWFRWVDSDSISVRHVTLLNTGGTDHLSFDRAGIPGFQFIQDPMEYSTRTHHSSQDFYERLVPADMKHNAVVIATLVYLAANAEERIPRK